MADPTNDQSSHDKENETTEAPSNREGASAPVDANDGGTEQDTSGDDATSASPSEKLTLLEAQKRAEEVAKELLDHQFDGIIKAEAADDDGWRTVAEVVERSAVPDTQDIIGRYEIRLDAVGDITGYELVERYQRGDMKEEL